jgi:formamidopyrimidine-DNA glycosylase
LRDFPGVIGDLDFPTFRSHLTGARIVGIERRGKYLAIRTDGLFLLQVHLRMTGRLLVVPHTAEQVRFEHLAISLDSGLDLRYGDQRKFGRVLLTDESAWHALSARLGPEPLGRDFTGGMLFETLSRRTGKIKSVLLDQSAIAGLGNIYVDEILFRCRIHPETIANSLTPEQATTMARVVRTVLRTAIANQGTTFSTFENPYGEAGSNAAFLQVYGRGGHNVPCPRCGTILQRIMVAGRGTTFCPSCQPAPHAKQMLS